MYKYLALFYFVSILVPLNAQPASSLKAQAPCVVAEVAPCAYVHDMVNAVDGSVYLKLPHISVPGHVPLDVVQYYTNKNDYTSWFGSGMTLNYSFEAWLKLSSDKKRDTNDKYSHLLAETAGGSIIRCLGKIKYGKYQDFFIDSEVLHEGFTNSSYAISARTNLKNTKISHKLKEGVGRIKSYLSDGSTRKYHRVFDRGTTYVDFEKRLNMTRLDFDYHWYEEILPGRKVNRVDSIKKIAAKANDHTLNWLAFSKKDRSAKITSSNGKSVELFGFEHNDNDYIHTITSSDNPTIKFDYTKAGSNYCIKRIRWPEDRCLEIEYDHKARVTSLKAPVGSDKNPHTLYTFHYHDHHTDVVDANKHKKTYNHKKGRVLSIDEEKPNNALYRSHAFYWGAKEHYSWGKHPKGNEGNLLAYATLNHKRCGQKLCYYDYDDFGNIIQETLCGNLYPFKFKSWFFCAPKSRD